MNNLFGFPKAQSMLDNLLLLNKTTCNMNCLNKTFNHNTMFHIHKIIESLVAIHGLHIRSPWYTTSYNSL